jgi:glutathione S-transferase
MLTLYDYLDSGNGFKVRLLLSQLTMQYRWIERDIMTGKTRTPDFLARNPNGRIPVIETDDGMCLAESNAILWYLADGTAFLPQDRMARAQVLQWMFFEQYSHEPYVATPRFIIKHLPLDSPRRTELPQRLAQGRTALAILDDHLKGRHFMVAETYSIADIALYAYTHVADEATLDLTPFAHLNAWLKRVSEQPYYIPLTFRPATI